MTAKRFTIDNDMSFDDKVETHEVNCIWDNENQTFYFIADSLKNVQLFIKQLNELDEENESLKEENKFLRNKVATYKKGNALLKSTMDKEWK